MIPLKLEISNFLSYRDSAVLDFDAIHLACISGLNGAGKSTILDAITWALFGRSRSKSDDDLVNRLAAAGGNGAEIKLTLSLEGIVYRVIRRKRPGKVTMLELQVQAGPNQWKTLSESGVRETQAAIEKLLRMSYETFINASFLLQGKADEFTTKSPNRRKEILADLLGVSQWEQHREAAADRRKEVEGRLALLDGMLEEIELELAEEPERQQAVIAAQDGMEIIQARVTDKEAVLQGLRRAETAVRQQRQMVDTLADNLTRARNSLLAVQRSQTQRQQEWENHQALLAEKAAIEESFSAWQKADEALQGWQTKAETYGRLQHAQRPHELAITRARTELSQRRHELETQSETARRAADEREAESEKLSARNERLGQILSSLEELKKQETIRAETEASVRKLESNRELFAQEMAQLRRRADRIQTLHEEKEAVSVNAKQAETLFAELTARVAALSVQNKQFVVNKADIDSLSAEQKRLRQEMDELKGRIIQLEAEAEGRCPLCGQPLTEDHRRSVKEELQRNGEQLASRFRDNKQRSEHLTGEIVRLEGIIKQGPRLERDHQTQQQRLAKAEARLEEIVQTLDEWHGSSEVKRLEALSAKLEDDSELSAQKERLAALDEVVAQKAALEADRERLQRQVTSSETRIIEIERSVTAWREVGKTELLDVVRTLERTDYAVEDQAALGEINDQIETLAYDGAAHDAARDERETLAGFPDRYNELRQVEAAIKPLEDGLDDLGKQVADQLKTVSDLAKQHESAVEELAAISSESGDLRGVEDEVFQLREQLVAANQRVGVALQKLAVLTKSRERRTTLTGERGDVTLLIKRLKLLERACGRNGVQALLIEHALPDIEDRANELLERLTNGEMRVSFETQKQLKSREAVVETLEIRIVDNAGERPYANFSGGEQFRVNFAIRLALSQILAKRAGARLQTLVIDEGFGSQDPSGRQRLVEAINIIQDDFARILIITHIDELRDAFPTRIEVEKRVNGSHITVS